MRLCVTLAFICTTLSAVYGLRCFTCWGANPGNCNQIWECPRHFDRCSSTTVAENMVAKHCMRSDMCNRVYSEAHQCCSEDLCNGAKHTGIFVPLLLAPIATITLFL